MSVAVLADAPRYERSTGRLAISQDFLCSRPCCPNTQMCLSFTSCSWRCSCSSQWLSFLTVSTSMSVYPTFCAFHCFFSRVLLFIFLYCWVSGVSILYFNVCPLSLTWTQSGRSSLECQPLVRQSLAPSTMSVLRLPSCFWPCCAACLIWWRPCFF